MRDPGPRTAPRQPAVVRDTTGAQVWCVGWSVGGKRFDMPPAKHGLTSCCHGSRPAPSGPPPSPVLSPRRQFGPNRRSCVPSRPNPPPNPTHTPPPQALVWSCVLRHRRGSEMGGSRRPTTCKRCRASTSEWARGACGRGAGVRPSVPDCVQPLTPPHPPPVCAMSFGPLMTTLTALYLSPMWHLGCT